MHKLVQRIVRLLLLLPQRDNAVFALTFAKSDFRYYRGSTARRPPRAFNLRKPGSLEQLCSGLQIVGVNVVRSNAVSAGRMLIVGGEVLVG